MARTKHKIVQKAAIGAAAYGAGKRQGAKNSDLKQAAHQGRAPVKDARSAQPGYAAVPVSTAALPPGQGPPMSSTPDSAGRGRKKSSRGKPTGPIRGFSGASSGSAQRIQSQAPTASAGGRGVSARRGRGRRKQRTS